MRSSAPWVRLNPTTQGLDTTCCLAKLLLCCAFPTSLPLLTDVHCSSRSCQTARLTQLTTHTGCAAHYPEQPHLSHDCMCLPSACAATLTELLLQHVAAAVAILLAAAAGATAS
jgi:hypothetical protein